MRVIARWIGADESQVIVQPNLEFCDYRASGDDLVKITTAIKLGFPMSLQSAYEYAQSKGYTKEPFDTQIEMIKKEKDSGLRDMLMPPEQDLTSSNSGLNPLNGNNAGSSGRSAQSVANQTTGASADLNNVNKVTK